VLVVCSDDDSLYRGDVQPVAWGGTASTQLKGSQKEGQKQTFIPRYLIDIISNCCLALKGRVGRRLSDALSGTEENFA
jgi:hypothetical protein